MKKIIILAAIMLSLNAQYGTGLVEYVKKNQVDNVSRALEHPALTKEEVADAFEIAVRNGSCNIVSVILEKRAALINTNTLAQMQQCVEGRLCTPVWHHYFGRCKTIQDQLKDELNERETQSSKKQGNLKIDSQIL